MVGRAAFPAKRAYGAGWLIRRNEPMDQGPLSVITGLDPVIHGGACGDHLGSRVTPGNDKGGKRRIEPTFLRPPKRASRMRVGRKEYLIFNGLW